VMGALPSSLRAGKTSGGTSGASASSYRRDE
jgi:hypothetical protein